MFVRAAERLSQPAVVELVRRFSFFACVSVWFRRAAVELWPVAICMDSRTNWLAIVVKTMVEAHFSHKYFVRYSDLFADNSNCHHSNCLRPMDECAYLDRRWGHRNDVECWAHSIRSVSFGHHLDVMQLAVVTSNLNDRHHTARAEHLHRAYVCLDALPSTVAERTVDHFHVDCSPNAWPICYPTNTMSNLNASMDVDTYSIDRLVRYFHFYWPLTMALEMILRSSSLPPG